MKKFGFTLAEVLITLSIIGVVAALTAPALVQSVGSAKVGPSLAKAVSTFTTANEMMLAQEELNSIQPGLFTVTSAGGVGKSFTKTYWSTMNKYMKVVTGGGVKTYYQYNSKEPYTQTLVGGAQTSFEVDSLKMTTSTLCGYTSEDGIVYYIHFTTKQKPSDDYADIPSNQLIGDLYIDINGAAKPNKIGKDLFRFYLYNDGSVKPYGGAAYDKTIAAADLKLWSNDNNCDDKGVNNPDTCAGSIFENNHKVIYQ